MSRARYSRRTILKSSAAFLATASFLAACGGGAPATATQTAATAVTPGSPAAGGGPKTLQLVQATGMVEGADTEFKRQVAAWAQANNATVNVEIAASQAMGAKISAAVNTQSGPDIILLQDYEIWQNAASLADVSRTAEALKGQLGGAYEVIDANCKVNGTYRAIPFTFFPSGWLYRTDWLKEAGFDKFPDTMEGLLQAGTKLKAAGHPIGQSIAANNGDARAFCYSVLWNFGARESDETGTKIALNSPETLAALQWAQQFLKDACDPGGFGWDGGGNNRAYTAKTIAATINGASVYIAAKGADPELAKLTDSAVSPKGPGGGWIYTPSRSYAVTKWSKQQEAAQGLLSYLLQPAQYNAWLTAAAGFNNGAYKAYDNHQVFIDDPKLKPFNDLRSQGRWGGWAGPPNDKAAQVWQQDVIVTMFAQLQGGTSPRDVISAAESRMKAIYG